jgi:hypothetical protein
LLALIIGLAVGMVIYYNNKPRVPAQSPGVVYQTSLDRVACFVVGSDGYLYDIYWNGQRWFWEEQGPPPGTAAVSSPSAVYQTSPDRLHCFVIGNNGPTLAETPLFERFRKKPGKMRRLR